VDCSKVKPLEKLDEILRAVVVGNFNIAAIAATISRFHQGKTVLLPV